MCTLENCQTLCISRIAFFLRLYINIYIRGTSLEEHRPQKLYVDRYINILWMEKNDIGIIKLFDAQK